MAATRKPSKKAVEKANAEFDALVVAHLLALGAVKGVPGVYREYAIETRFGTLGLTPYGDWVACAFVDVARAKAGFGDDPLRLLNPYSGKWNHHYSHETPAADRFADFARRLKAVLPA